MAAPLDMYSGSPTKDTSVSLPVPWSKDWFTAWASTEAALRDQVRKTTLDKAAIILPPAGLAIPTGSQAVWDLAQIVDANPQAVNFTVFWPVLVLPTATPNRYKKLVIDTVNFDLYTDLVSSPGQLILANSSGADVLVFGFVKFVQYANYVTGFGPTP